MTKRVVTTRVQFGKFGATADTDALLDQAFVAADDGDCGRTAKALDRAEAAGVNVGFHRRQLLQDCKLARGGLAMGGLTDDVRGAFRQEKLLSPYTVGALVLGAWLGAKVFR